MQNNLHHKPLPSIEKLKEKIEKASKKDEVKSNSSTRYAIDLIAGVVVGGFSGYFLDKYFGTMPVFFLICLIFGMIAGFLNIVRASKIENAKSNKNIK